MAKRKQSRDQQTVHEDAIVKAMLALVGFQGRGFADGVQPNFCYSLLLEAFIFQWS